MSRRQDLSCVRAIVVSSGLAQTLFWMNTLGVDGSGLAPFDLVFLSLTLPTTAMGVLGLCIPLAAGLAAAGLAINLGLLIALTAQA